MEGEAVGDMSFKTEEVETSPTRSKRPPRSERKRRRYEELLTEKRENRKKKKMERKERMTRKEKMDAEIAQPRIAEGVSKKEEKAIIKQRLMEAMMTGQKICIDCSLEEHMSEKEKGKLAMQIGRAYGSNRRAADPAHLYLTGLDKNGTLYDQCVKKNDGFTNYVIDVHSIHHSLLFPKDKTVYLTPDSDKSLTDIDKDKIYIIGGLVDESISKNITKEKAGETGIVTARLPVDEYMEKIPQDSHSKVLAVNQVFDILLTYINTKDWKKALSAGVPKRKGYVVKDLPDT